MEQKNAVLTKDKATGYKIPAEYCKKGFVTVRELYNIIGGPFATIPTMPYEESFGYILDENGNIIVEGAK